MIRYAIYYIPTPESPLALEAAQWLGRDVFTGNSLPRRSVANISAERFGEIVGSPRHYGFHATLKPPFVLAPDRSLEQLVFRLETFSKELAVIYPGKLAIKYLHDFFCIRPVTRCQQLHELADQVVSLFDDFRAPTTEAELARRRNAKLSANQELMLTSWGYPYVMNEFRFHLTLTGRITDPQEKHIIAQELEKRFRPLLQQPTHIDSLAIVEERDGTAMTVVERFPIQHQSS